MNLKLATAGFAIQAAQGAAEAQPAFSGPVGGGKLATVEVSQVEDELTSAQIGSPGEYRESVSFSGEWEGRAWPAPSAACSTPCSARFRRPDPLTRTRTRSRRRPRCRGAPCLASKDSERKAIADAKLDELKLEWEGNAPIKLTPAWLGLDVTWSGAAFVPVVDESDADTLKGVGLAAVIDLDGSGYDGGAVAARRLRRRQAQPHGRREVWPARALRRQRGRLRVRRGAQVPRP